MTQLDLWRDDYDRVRPHSALKDRTPEEWGGGIQPC